MERQLLKAVTQLTLMNTKMVSEIFRQHHELVEKVLPLLPGEQSLIFQISKTEQLSAAVSQLTAAVEKMLKACD
jgi:hydroxymethylpyrimidine/phosphomethylpyrimidine kinase